MNTVEKIKRDRIRIALFAYAYEFEFDSLISDTEYDKLSLALDYTSSTDNEELDDFFLNNYNEHTGMWIRKHPDVFSGKLKILYEKYKNLTST